MTANTDLLTWMRTQCAEYEFDVRGVFRKDSKLAGWPLTADSPEDLELLLASGGHLLPLPKEPAALANIVEVSLVDFLMARLDAEPHAAGARGTERSYPDLEVSGPRFGGEYHAVDVKVAKRADEPAKRNSRFRERTQSRITLYTGNTYFKFPHLTWPGNRRPFGAYVSHLDILAVYTLVDAPERIADLELLVHPSWQIASRERSSTTREYIGAVDGIAELRAGSGVFDTEEQFYKYWRGFPFKVSKHVQSIQGRLLREQGEELARLRAAQQAAHLGPRT